MLHVVAAFVNRAIALLSSKSNAISVGPLLVAFVVKAGSDVLWVAAISDVPLLATSRQFY